MPVLSSSSLLSPLLSRDTATNISSALTATNATVQVVCAWPVSGQYGPGSRLLYYVLVAACVLARKAKWLRGPCLVAALLFPAVAAIHAIVLAAVHVDGAVDMDIYGALQLCSIGILTAPASVRLSSTYFNDPGRNTIFLWTGLVLSGLVSLVVEFYRSSTVGCSVDDAENSINPDDFPYENAMCGLTCSVGEGPFSPMRMGSANNIYVIPAPNRLTFGTGTLIAAACGIPAILSLVFMSNKILEINWTSRFGNQDDRADEVIQGTNGATVGTMRNVNKMVREWLSVVEIPVFGGAVLAILILGETNFFSGPVRFQTEPMASIGQWAPVAGTSLAALGSLYLLLAEEVDDVKNEIQHCNCQHEHPRVSRSSRDDPTTDDDVAVIEGQRMQEVDVGMIGHPQFYSDHGTHDMHTTTSHQVEHTNTHHTLFDIENSNSRRKVAKALTRVSNWLGVAIHTDDSEFRRGRAVDYPEIPGERQRNPELLQIIYQYNPSRDADGNATPVPGRSRSNSFIASGSTTPRASSPFRRPYANTLPSEQTTPGTLNQHSPPLESSPSSIGGRRRVDILEVPPPTHRSASRNHNATHVTASSVEAVPGSPVSPAIVVSSDDDATPSVDETTAADASASLSFPGLTQRPSISGAGSLAP
ncbi:hypothetical protein B0H63DRAFT_487308 [Podospora didyma]|uniref:Uncharacterized protein n=1 Tax=Podospora didyma TaxID=330526 RepID=A0AAE0K6L2_9PEZI|nr:hypothetical protein B0H63DRAFT_487308 [Podospora didyma]